MPTKLKTEIDSPRRKYPRSAPIKGFGGTSSGPDPLIELHQNLKELYDSRIGQKITSVDIVDMVARRFEGTLFVVEPHIDALPEDLQFSPNLKLTGLRDGLDHSDIVVLLTDHLEFRSISADCLKDKQVIDTRGVWRSIG